ncbi:alpha/beta fold hydrolase [Robertkochia aurantiaca]|uniref:alpha/beta fold hydrolase n=1 Tax=Robertkochia aurantiaca TaxID=2873700 RepID=UPI001CCDDF89|nr:alpha/beta hydrolase [Robertkochia sp. 3YJGBD-33]
MELKYKGTPIFYREEGKGTALILLHGFLEHSGIWDDLTAAFSDRYRVIRIDLPGHGNSGCNGYIHTMEFMAESVKAVLDHLRIRRAVLAGHSMGGYVALALSEKYPELPKALILINSTPLADSEEKKKNRDRAIAAVKHNHKNFIRVSVSNLFRPKNRKIFREEINTLKEEALKTPLQGIVAALEGMKIRLDREVIMYFTPYPKMVILGAKDPVVDANSLAERLKRSAADIVVLPDGHMSFIENREALKENIGNFLKKI